MLEAQRHKQELYSNIERKFEYFILRRQKLFGPMIIDRTCPIKYILVENGKVMSLNILIINLLFATHRQKNFSFLYCRLG